MIGLRMRKLVAPLRNIIMTIRPISIYPENTSGAYSCDNKVSCSGSDNR
jgi:hypothetical protein